MARSSKLTEELMKNFVAAQSMGLSIKSSCDYCGITERVYYKWMEQAREDLEVCSVSSRSKKSKCEF